MNEVKIIVLLCILSLNWVFCSGQDRGVKSPVAGTLQLTIDGSLRYRYEHWHNVNTKNYADDSPDAIGNLDDDLLYQRLILGITAKNKRLTVSFHLQDSRAFGWSLRNARYPSLFRTGNAASGYIMNPSEEFFEIYDANIEIRDIIPHLSLKVGRQKISCADSRIFGPGDWGNTGRWNWDAVKFSYKKGKLSFDTWAGGTKIHNPVKTYFPFTHTEFYGAGFYGTYHFRQKASFEGYAAYKRQGSADFIRDQCVNLYWLGGRIASGDSLSLVYEANGVKQFGTLNKVTSNGYAFFTKVGYRFISLPWIPILTIRYSYASGNQPNTPFNESFDPVYGASDKYYGWMNLVKWTNLDDREIVLDLSPISGLTIELKYNRFYIPEPMNVTINGTLKLMPDKHYLGEEWDAFIKYKLSGKWQFVLASGIFRPHDVEYINNKIAGNAFWVGAQAEYFINYRLNHSKLNRS